MAKFYLGIILTLAIICAVLGWQLYDTGTRLEQAIRNYESIREYQQQVIDGLKTLSTGINNVSSRIRQVGAGIGEVKDRLGSDVDSITEGSELIGEQRKILEKVRRGN